MDRAVLDRKVAALAREPGVDPELAYQLGATLASRDDWQLLRINPVRFAAELGWDPRQTLDLMLRAVRTGLLDFAWSFVCPLCGGVEQSYETIAALAASAGGEFHCTPCDIDTVVELDEVIEVSFTINASVHALRLDVYADVSSYERYFRSASVERSPEMQRYLDHNRLAFRSVPPGGTERLRFDAAPGHYRLTTYDVHDRLEITVEERPAAEQHLDVQLGSGGLVPRDVVLGAGNVALHVHNHTPARAGVTLFRVKRDEIMGIIANSPNCWHPRLSGKLLLNNQTFRDVFGMDRLRSTLQLKMRSLTILFTDLKGSTAIYDRVGDLVAYSLVRDHFAVLRDAVREHSGAIVKTMGDSLMATFSSPDDGVAAALAMMSGVACLGERWQRDGLELGLKIGLHEGPALVINADERLDYFGQAVNIAARVQGLAAAGEVWLTAAIFGYEAVRRQLEARHLEPRPLTAALKGVGDPVAVYCCQVAAPRGQPVPTR